MEKLKEYKYIILIGLVILGLAFYWMQIRPVIVRKNCFYVTKALPAYISDEQYDICSKSKTSYDCFLLEKEIKEKPAQPKKEFITEATEKEYGQCLREHGLDR